MEFRSILFKNEKNRGFDEVGEVQEFFKDLNLDQIIESITENRKEYNLKPFFYKHLTDLSEISYRHEIMRDVEKDDIFKAIDRFADQMNFMKQRVLQCEKLNYEYQRKSWFLQGIDAYCNGVIDLLKDLNSLNIESTGLISFREFLSKYVKCDEFISIKNGLDLIKEKLDSIRYCFFIKGNTVTVSKYDGEEDYGIDVVETFKKFKEKDCKDYTYKFQNTLEMNHVESSILDRVVLLYPDEFEKLTLYYENNQDFQDETIKKFDREIQFYMAYIDYLKDFKKIGLNFCYPKVSDKDKEIYVDNAFDLALAKRLMYEKKSVICNDFYLENNERIFVISGPNQGGKTTFARTFGQINYLGSLGCEIPGIKGRTYLFDNIFTHFEREEDIKTLSGKLQDDLNRIHHILEEATPKSIIIMNEIFSSTTLKDALFLGEKILNKIDEKDILCVFVTFIDELGDLSEKIVTMVSNVDPSDSSIRTYKIKRKSFDGQTYAMTIAKKYGLTYARIKERIE